MLRLRKYKTIETFEELSEVVDKLNKQHKRWIKAWFNKAITAAEHEDMIEFARAYTKLQILLEHEGYKLLPDAFNSLRDFPWKLG